MTVKLTDLLGYQKQIEALFDTDSDLIVTNRDRDHAAVIVSTLFTRAKKSVILFCKNLDGDFYNRRPIRCAIVEAVKNGVNVEILVQEVPEANELLADLDSLSTRTNLRIGKCKPGISGAETEINFAVMDGKAFRLENDRNLHTALACAKNSELAEKLIQLFRVFCNDAQTIEPFILPQTGSGDNMDTSNIGVDGGLSTVGR